MNETESHTKLIPTIAVTQVDHDVNSAYNTIPKT